MIIEACLERQLDLHIVEHPADSLQCGYGFIVLFRKQRLVFSVCEVA